MTVITRFHIRERTRDAAKVASAALVLSLLVLHASLFSQVAQHSLQHAHHQATTHGSLLCTWLCTAGEISEAVAVAPSAVLIVVRSQDPRVPSKTVPGFSIEPSSRAPPFDSPSTST